MDTDVTAKRMYTTYCQAVGGFAYNGDPLPTAEEFFSDPNKQKQADAWREVAKKENFYTMFPMGMKG